MRTFKFQFVIECAGAGQADQELVAKMIDLSMQDLVMDDEFIGALDEKEAVTIQVIPILDK